MKDLLGGLLHYVTGELLTQDACCPPPPLPCLPTGLPACPSHSLAPARCHCAVEPPPPHEQLRILTRLYPQLAPLLPLAMDTLALVQAAYGQQRRRAEHEQQQQQEGADEADSAVASALATAELGVGGLGLGVGRHFSVRDLVKWCRRMQAVRSGCLLADCTPCLHAASPARCRARLHVFLFFFGSRFVGAHPQPHTHHTPSRPPGVQLHGPLLQRTLKAVPRDQGPAAAAALPLALREAAFGEAADCFAALLGREQAADRLLRALAALWAVPAEAVLQYSTLAKPAVQVGREGCPRGLLRPPPRFALLARLPCLPRHRAPTLPARNSNMSALDLAVPRAMLGALIGPAVP